MKLISWNVNGLRAVVGKGFSDIFRKLDADVFCLQETKLQEGQIDIDFPGYFQYWNYAEKKGYSGTAVFTKEEPISVTRGIGIPEHDKEGRVLTLEQIPDAVANAMISLTDNKIVILLIINLLLLACGCLLETNSSILILAPILYPVVAAYVVSIIHFGIIMVVNLAIGFITPPVGVNLFVACGIGKIPFADLVKKIIPFLIALLIGLILITYVPAISMMLPNLIAK